MRRSQTVVDLFNSQSGLCVYCFERMKIPYGHRRSITRDHVVPRAAGGKTKPHNIAGACYACNQEKRDTPLVIFLLRRRSAPRPV